MPSLSTFIAPAHRHGLESGVRRSAHRACAYPLLALLVSAAITVPGAPATAYDRRATPVVARVFYGDLDLKTKGGAQRMWLRIGRAADDACGLPRTDLHMRAAVDARHCRMAVISKAVKSLDAPLVTAEFDKVYRPSATLTAAR